MPQLQPWAYDKVAKLFQFIDKICPFVFYFVHMLYHPLIMLPLRFTNHPSINVVPTFTIYGYNTADIETCTRSQWELQAPSQFPPRNNILQDHIEGSDDWSFYYSSFLPLFLALL